MTYNVRFFYAPFNPDKGFFDDGILLHEDACEKALVLYPQAKEEVAEKPEIVKKPVSKTLSPEAIRDLERAVLNDRRLTMGG